MDEEKERPRYHPRYKRGATGQGLKLLKNS
jgi:hypothetical protein